MKLEQRPCSNIQIRQLLLTQHSTSAQQKKCYSNKVVKCRVQQITETTLRFICTITIDDNKYASFKWTCHITDKNQWQKPEEKAHNNVLDQKKRKAVFKSKIKLFSWWKKQKTRCHKTMPYLSFNNEPRRQKPVMRVTWNHCKRQLSSVFIPGESHTFVDNSMETVLVPGFFGSDL